MFLQATPKVRSVKTPEQSEQPLSDYIGPHWVIAAWIWIVLVFWALLFGLLWF